MTSPSGTGTASPVPVGSMVSSRENSAPGAASTHLPSGERRETDPCPSRIAPDPSVGRR